MAATKISTFGANLVTNAAAIATAMGGGSITSAEVTALGKFLNGLATQPNLVMPAFKLALPNDIKLLLPS